jgi:nucleotide-binding universal stress UspA family protein
MNESAARHSLVVGLATGGHRATDRILREAVAFAQGLGAELVVATVDSTHVAIRTTDDGEIVAWDLDPDVLDEELIERFDDALAQRVRELAEPAGVRCSFRALAGDPARALASVADDTDAVALVVGARPRSARTAAHEFFNGSVAARLAHRQHRPVIVIPLDTGA